MLGPMRVVGVCLLTGEEVIGLILQRLSRTPDHGPQRRRCNLGCHRQLDRQGVHLLLVLCVFWVAGGGLCHERDQEEGNEAAGGRQSCNRRDGAAREVEGNRE